MNTTLTINGRTLTADIEPRQHLADFLREELHLTATHLGCEHGICGACTLLIDNAPARSCIAFAALINNANITTLEGLASDPAITALRTAFTQQHALQCGYCTPGMLITARDILHRLPDANDDRIRLELAGNLCRCTGYNGIVKAIRQVLDMRLNFGPPPQTPLPAPHLNIPPAAQPASLTRQPTPTANNGKSMAQSLTIAVTPETLWTALQNPVLIASCIPGAILTTQEGNDIAGEMSVSLGPIQAKFTGSAQTTYGQMSGAVTGQGQDQLSKTRLSAAANFSITPMADASRLNLNITYSLRGALAQFARPSLVETIAAELINNIALNLQAKLTGTIAPSPKTLSAPALAVKILWQRLKQLFGKP